MVKIPGYSLARSRKAIRHFFFTVQKHMSALPHRKPTLIIINTSKTQEKIQLYTLFSLHSTVLAQA